MTRTPKTRKTKSTEHTDTTTIDNTGVTVLGKPGFAQPHPTPDPTKFEIKHPTDDPIYKKIDELNREHKIAPLPFPPPRGLPEPKLTLAAALDTDGKSLEGKLKANGQIVFHALGDTGSTRGPESQNLVADKLVGDFSDHDKEKPLFFFHLGDVIYSFGEARYYYDQFYEPYRDYPAPILALAGNHDGMVAPETNAATLAAFLENFCAPEFEVTSEAGGLSRTAQIQPGVFYTFEAPPFVRILALYSNTLEDPGVISDRNIGDSQLAYLKVALNRVKSEGWGGRLFSRTTIPLIRPEASTAGASRCFRKSTPFAMRPVYGHMPSYPAMLTTISGSRACTDKRRYPISCVATEATQSRS